jgi:hypothetical protein
MKKTEISEAAAAMGRIGGSKKSEKKAAAVRKNLAYGREVLRLQKKQNKKVDKNEK